MFVSSSLEAEEVAALIAEAQRRGLPVPEEAEYWLLRHEAQRRGIVPWSSYGEFLAETNRGETPIFDMEHIPLLAQVADDVIEGRIMALLVLLPTRYLKTEVFGRQLIPYFLHKHPTRWAGLASYNADLAWETSAAARANFLSSGGKIAEDAAAKKFWSTTQGGGLWATGVDSGTIGRGMHLGIVDDPIDPQNVLSPTFQRRFQAWWPSTFLSRREGTKNTRLVFVMQRLGSDDPVDFLFRREIGENTEKAPMHWHVLVLDEIKSDEPLGRWGGPMGLPLTCTLIEDSRSVGEPLAPSRFSLEEVKQMQADAGPYIASTQRQQRPMRPSGDFWLLKWFKDRVYDVLPSHAFNGGKDWDTAYGENTKNSASAWVESYRGLGEKDRFPIYVQDLGWDWLEFPQLVGLMQDLTGPHYVEAKASGKSAVQTLAAYDIRAEEVPVHGSKLSRASAAQPAVSTGRIFIRKEVYQQLLYGEEQGLLRVTAERLAAEGPGLDLNDVFVQAIHRHLGIGSVVKAKRQASVWTR